VILQRCCSSIVENWLAPTKQSSDLNCLPLNQEECTGYIPKLVEDLSLRLSQSSATTKDSSEENLITLCNDCHTRIHRS